MSTEVQDRLWDATLARLTAATTSLAEPQATDLFNVPLYPPKWWFDKQQLPLREDGSVPDVTVLPDGRVYGYFFEWGQCILGSGVGDECWTPPPSPTDYTLFHQSHVEVTNAQGEIELMTAGLLVPGHSPPNASTEASIHHYNDPTRGVVIGRVYEDERGGYIVGSIAPGKTYAEVAMVQHSALSGHWEFLSMDGRTAAWDCLGPCLVVRPGLPLNTSRARWATAVMPRLSEDGRVTAYIGVIPDQEVKAAAGTPLTFGELRQEVEEQAKTLFTPPQDGWVWVVDFDDTYAVVSIEDMSGETKYWVPMTIHADGTVTFDQTQMREVEVEYVPKRENVTAAIDPETGEEEVTAPETPKPDSSSSAMNEIMEDLLSRVGALQAENGAIKAEIEAQAAHITTLQERIDSLEAADTEEVLKDAEIEDLEPLT